MTDKENLSREELRADRAAPARHGALHRIAMLVLAFLVSPFGLPAIGEWLLDRLYGVKYALQDFMTSR